MKHATRWTVRQLPDGVLEWTSPLGDIHRDEPEPQGPRFADTPAWDPRESSWEIPIGIVAPPGPDEPPWVYGIGLDGLRVIAVERRKCDALTVTVESPPGPVGCPGCGVLAVGHGRAPVPLVDAPAMGRPVRLLWRKRRWRCHEPACPVVTFVEQNEQVAASRSKLTTRAAWWAIEQIRREHASVTMTQPRVVTFLGPRGTFTEAALEQVEGLEDAERIPVANVAEALTAVATGRSDAAMIAIENSIEGGVTAAQDALAATPGLRIISEHVVSVNFSLVAPAGTRLDDIRVIAAHPVAWAQCSE
ncbi:prephenate dehydratase domain-containing protein [Agrococcus beijingensis]|uniref:prephenate dehydratase domain-containing protein n=1 Tax=Agrococcus beijingensis TaxID=3068634 RepID=UPI0027417D23|nr:prephenate dehydratase domain-containing protein [Agrococcus sp. REN33]